MRLRIDPVTGARSYEEGIDWGEWRTTLIVLAVVAVLLYLWDPNLLSEPWRLFRWFEGGSFGN